MNYVILNGVKSNTVKGLLIQSLPPISKPLMRTEVEEIDGRDGDIVTKLGYSAYDRPMEIGLYGDYDVDDVISYFDSEGEVVFSNEPDKYYKYQIIQQIDFEKLIRFRTATVVFHVQPFKYSAVDNSYEVTNDSVSVSNYSATKNGITVSAKNDVITVKGTGLVATEFYVPVLNQSLNAGDYTLTLTARGTMASACSVRLIKSVPSNADSFAGNYLALQNNAVVSMSGQVADNTEYGYVWLYITSGTTVNFTLDVSLTNNAFNEVKVRNIGNTIAKPTITLYGSGTVALSINGTQLFTIDLGGADYITLDAVEMNAYYDGILMNRNVTGNYDNLVLRVGTNTISWTGNVTSCTIQNFSRWT